MSTEMKTWDSVKEKATLLHNIRKPFDHLSPVKRYSYHPANLTNMVDNYESSDVAMLRRAQEDTAFEYQLTHHAESQLLAKLRYPRQLLNRVHPNLSYASIMWLMQNDEDVAKRNALFRFHQDTHLEQTVVRAVMGPRYQPIDDMDLLSHIDPYLKGAQVIYDGFGENSTHLTAIWPDNPLEGGLIPGIHIANSEVGLRSISLSAVLFRGACGNILPGWYDAEGRDDSVYDGADTVKARINRKGYQGRVSTQWRFRHVGTQQRLADWIRLGMDDLTIQWDVTVAKWKQGMNTLVKDPLGSIADIGRDAALTQAQIDAAITAWPETKEDFGSSATGIANTFTLGAQQFRDPEQRYGMQQAGALALGTL